MKKYKKSTIIFQWAGLFITKVFGCKNCKSQARIFKTKTTKINKKVKTWKRRKN